MAFKNISRNIFGGEKFPLYDSSFVVYLQVLLNLKIQSCSLKTLQITSQYKMNFPKAKLPGRVFEKKIL